MEEGYRKIGKYEISDMCLESYPCQHYIRLENKTARLMSGADIYCLFKSEGLSDPHINQYAEFVRQRDFPTEAEIQKRQMDMLICQQNSDKRKKEEAERQQTIDLYKASSRIDKLKNRHNITK